MLLNEATTLVELATVYKSLSVDDQKLHVALKDRRKADLTPPSELPPPTEEPAALPAIPADRLKKLMTSIKKEGADITSVLKLAREQFSFTPEQETEFNTIIAEKAAKKQAA
ncbi:hypothetical protein D3C86_1791130 [compost metagenome]